MRKPLSTVSHAGSAWRQCRGRALLLRVQLDKPLPRFRILTASFAFIRSKSECRKQQRLDEAGKTDRQWRVILLKERVVNKLVVVA